MSEKSLVARAQAAVGDADTIIAAAAFQPHGARGAISVGALGGEVLGHAIDGKGGGDVLAMAGAYAATKLVEKHAGGHVDGEATDDTVSLESLVAVSENRIYAWHLHHGIHAGARKEIFAMDRSDVSLDVHDAIGYHVLTVKDLRNGEVWKFQADHRADHSRDFFAALHPVEA